METDDPHRYFNLSPDVYSQVYSTNGLVADELKGDLLFIGMGDLYLPGRVSSKRVTIVEFYPEAIERNRPFLLPEWRVIEADGYLFIPDQDYDTIILDMWYFPVDQQIVLDQVDRYSKYLIPGGKVVYLSSVLQEKTES
jgi:hypothetical protein